ncbi:MAG: class I SAM-dependent methyltransferase [Candidatus Hydrogenedentes bacterium]|nr:class I SAM-dependent methyltransferase [Candidatus Hydrogenedentota bacterium]
MADLTRDEYKQFHRRRHAMLLKLLGRHVPGKVDRALDAGGGGDVSGLGAILRDRFAGEVHAVDLGADVEEGRRQGVIAVECDIDRQPLPYPNGHFDLVVFASVIEHLYNPAFALAELARVTRPAGTLILEAPNAVALGRRLDALAGRNPFEWFNRYNALQNKARMEHCSVFYTAEEVERLLVNNFTVLERRYCMHDPKLNMVKKLVRESAFRFRPRLGDCFFVVARRLGG